MIAEIGRMWVKDQRDEVIREGAEKLGLSVMRLRARLREIGFTGVRRRARMASVL